MSHRMEARLQLLDLPREIREKIYDRLFEDATLTFEIHPESCAGFDKRPPFWVLLPKSTFTILLTCRTLYYETQERRFSVQSWHFKNIGGLEYFNRFASKTRKATVRQVSGIQLAHYRFKAQLCQLPNLKYVHVGPKCVHHPIMPDEAQSASSARPGRRFDDIGWDVLIHSVNQAGFDWIAPYGLQPLISDGKWEEFVLSVDFDVDEYGHSRYWVPTRLNTRTKEIVRYWDQMRDSKGGVSWSELRPPPIPSPCVLAEFETAKADPQAHRDRWKKYMTVK